MGSRTLSIYPFVRDRLDFLFRNVKHPTIISDCIESEVWSYASTGANVFGVRWAIERKKPFILVPRDGWNLKEADAVAAFVTGEKWRSEREEDFLAKVRRFKLPLRLTVLR